MLQNRTGKVVLTVLDVFSIGHSNLFRISKFEFRIYSMVLPPFIEKTEVGVFGIPLKEGAKDRGWPDAKPRPTNSDESDLRLLQYRRKLFAEASSLARACLRQLLDRQSP